MGNKAANKTAFETFLREREQGVSTDEATQHAKAVRNALVGFTPEQIERLTALKASYTGAQS